MRKIFLAFITVSLLANIADAQITKGSIFLGGDIGGGLSKTTSNGTTTNKQNGVNISPVFGKAIRENLVLGFNAGFGISNNEVNPNNAEYDIKSYFAGVFLRKYRNIATSGFYLFLQGGVGVSYLNQDQTGTFVTPDETKRLTIGLTAYPGISYAVSKKLHLETGFNNLLTLSYSNEKREVGTPITTYKTNAFALSSSLNNATSSLYLGFRVLIGK